MTSWLRQKAKYSNTYLTRSVTALFSEYHLVQVFNQIKKDLRNFRVIPFQVVFSIPGESYTDNINQLRMLGSLKFILRLQFL